MDSKINYYELLGVENTASKEEIEKAYKIQMKKWHPDINKSNEAPKMAIKLNEAKSILLDDEKRREYDLSLDNNINENYNKYTGNEGYEPSQGTSDYNDMITKWEYLKEYMKYSKDKFPRKIIAWIGVYLETFLCFLIKIILIGFAYISTIGSSIILNIFGRLFPFACLILVFLMYMINNQGFDKVMENNGNLAIGIAIFFGLYVLALFLPIVAKVCLSPRMFYILYNKIDIILFKWCVGYKD